MRQDRERVHAVDDVHTHGHYTCQAQRFTVQREAVKSARVCNPGQRDMRDARVDELEVRQVLDRRQLEGMVPDLRHPEGSGRN